MMKKLLIISLLLGLYSCNSSYQAPLMVGTNLWVGYEPLYLARSLGLYDNANIRLVELSSTSQTMDALRIGKLGAAAVTLDEALMLAQENVPIKIIWVLNISHGADALVAKPAVQKLSDLKGKRIGIEQTAVGAFLLYQALQQAALDVKKVQVVPVPLDEHLSMWINDEVDALVTFEPVLSQIKAERGHVLFDSSVMDVKIADVLVAREEALGCCSDRLRTLIAGQQQALQYLQIERKAALVLMAARSQSHPQAMLAALESVMLPDWAAVQRLLTKPAGQPSPLVQRGEQLVNMMLEQGLLPASTTVAPLIDERFVHKEQP